MLARPVDGRADLYALGVVLFQCATGHLPFRHDDLGQLLILHATAPVPDPRGDRPDVPAHLADLIMRLMAKDPDDRVQTARDLMAALGRQPPAAELSSTIIGRADEQARLADWWRRARTGCGRTVLLTGPAGVGKSSLARELARTAHADGVLVLAGKCADDASLPMAPVRAAVDAYLSEVVAFPAEARADAVAGLRAAAGDGAGLLGSLSPALAGLIDARERDSGLGEEGRRDQFTATVAAFLAALATRHGGLLLLIDDVQWLDPPSREVLRHLAEAMPTVPLLVVATARDEDLVAITADERLAVHPLDGEQAARLVSSYLAGLTVSPEVIAELTAQGRGNPFMILEYLHALIEAGALLPCWGEWRLDADQLRAIDLPSDVFALVLARIDGLGANAHETLAAAAALGFRFEPELLTEVLRRDPARDLAEGLERGLLHSGRAGFAFVHDRVREALLSGVGQADLRRLHRRIAAVLAAQDRSDPPHVYALARHCADGGLDQQPERVFTTGWAAGQLALADHAPDAAVSFLEAAAAGARAAGLEPDNRFREALAVAYLRGGDAEAARAQLEPALAVETAPIRRAELLLQLAHAHRAAWRMSASVDCVRAGLAELGRPMPLHPALLGLSSVRTLLWWLVTGGRRPVARPATGESSRRRRLYARLCAAGSTACAQSLHPDVAVFNLWGVRGAHRLGASTEYIAAYASMAVFAGVLRLGRRKTRTFRRLERMAAELGDPSLRAILMWVEAYSDMTVGQGDPAAWVEVAERNRRWLDVDSYLHSALVHCLDLIARGYADEALTWIDRGRGRVADPDGPQLSGLVLAEAMARSLRGEDPTRPAALARLGEPGLEPALRLTLASSAAFLAAEREDWSAEFDGAADVLAAPGLRPMMLVAEHRNVYITEASGRLARCRPATGAQRDELLRSAAAAVRRLGRVAVTPLLRGHHTVAWASLAELRGRPAESLALLARADNDLVRLDAPLVHFEAARIRARALRALDLPVPAQTQADVALLLATRHGWARRVRSVRAEFTSTDTRASGYTRESDLAGNRYRRRLEALQQVGAAAATVLDPHELARVALDETLHILGAERAILFLCGEDGRPRPSIGRTGAGELTELTGYSASLVDRVAADRRALVVTGSAEGAALGSQSTIVHGLRSIMIAPLEREDRLLGVVYLDSRVAKGIFTEDDISILTAVAYQVAVSLETARAAQLEMAVQAARQQRDTAEALRAAMSELIEVLEPDQVLHRLRNIAARTLPAEQVWLLHTDGDRRTAVPEADVDEVPDLRAPVRDGVLPSGLGMLVGDATAWLAVPLPTPGCGQGVLVAAGWGEPFTPAQLDMAAALAGQGGAAYTNARLFAEVQRLATTDGLTGVSNRRHFTDLATAQVTVAARNGRPLSALMIDIDHFKKINDTYGHGTGDDVIRAVAGVLHAGIRQPDVLCRYGGEEFALIMSEMHGDPAAAAERLRKTVETLAVPGPAGPVHVTVSIGVAALRAGDELDTVLARADEALYRAKQSGRNQVQRA